jgi:hypothetical protein
MSQVVDSLILDLLEWLARRERTYEETMAAWRTSCPKLTVWEDATDHGLVDIRHESSRSIVYVTSEGLAHLRRFRPESTR